VPSPNTLEKVEIAELIDRYFAALDQKQLDETTLSALFAAGGRIVRPNGAATVGPRAIAESHERSMSRFRATQHLTSGFIVTFAEGGQSAQLRVNFVAMHLWADGQGDAQAAPDDNYFVAGGVLNGIVLLTENGWRLSELASKPTWRRGVGFQQMLETR
jgi:hypothetical protein